MGIPERGIFNSKIKVPSNDNPCCLANACNEAKVEKAIAPRILPVINVLDYEENFLVGETLRGDIGTSLKAEAKASVHFDSKSSEKIPGIQVPY